MAFHGCSVWLLRVPGRRDWCRPEHRVLLGYATGVVGRMNLVRSPSSMALRVIAEEGRDVEGFDLKGATPANIAKYLASVSNGIAVRSAGGVGRAELRVVAEIALRALLSR
jgi:hypothetical protein